MKVPRLLLFVMLTVFMFGWMFIQLDQALRHAAGRQSILSLYGTTIVVMLLINSFAVWRYRRGARDEGLGIWIGTGITLLAAGVCFARST